LSSKVLSNNSFYRASGHDIDVVAELLDELVGRQGRPVDARENVKEKIEARSVEGISYPASSFR
jgi:hypothetical protein